MALLMLTNAKRIVIKVGSSLLVEEAGELRAQWLAAFAEDIAALVAEKKEIILVTSGAIALGCAQLGLKAKSLLLLEEKQAAASCGQITLFSAWRDALAKHNLKVGQLLLTADDSIHRRRYLNARNTIDTLLELGAIPIINENDTVATAEIRFGDNDRLSARVAQMAAADVLILLSDIDGLYTADPTKNKNAEFVSEVQAITSDIEKMAGGSATAIGSGGMITKLGAAKIAMAAGCNMIIARGIENHALKSLFGGNKHTRFVAAENPQSARKHWIAGSVHPAGSITIDDGAAKALASGKSLLPAGVTAAHGAFMRGDTVLIKNKNGDVLGKGLVAYDVADATRILGKKSADIEAILGFKRRDVLIHRDDMVLE
jgi:glutamate 5-kinase